MILFWVWRTINDFYMYPFTEQLQCEHKFVSFVTMFLFEIHFIRRNTRLFQMCVTEGK